MPVRLPSPVHRGTAIRLFSKTLPWIVCNFLRKSFDSHSIVHRLWKKTSLFFTGALSITTLNRAPPYRCSRCLPLRNCADLCGLDHLTVSVEKFAKAVCVKDIFWGKQGGTIRRLREASGLLVLNLRPPYRFPVAALPHRIASRLSGISPASCGRGVFLHLMTVTRETSCAGPSVREAQGRGP